jgi:hypothetical protein
MNNRGAKLLVLIAIAGLAIVLWYLRDEFLPATGEIVVIEPEPVDAKMPARSGPLYPVTPAEPVDDDFAPLPPLDDNDFRTALMRDFGPDAGGVLATKTLVEKFVVTVDNLSRPQVAERIRVVGNAPGEFVVEAAGDDGQYYISPENYARYDLFVDMVANTDPEAIAATYRRFYPVLQKTYVEIGYPDGYFNDRVIEVIDHLLLTPNPAEPILLVRPVVLYQFADEELEALSSGQKLLIRMGGENAATIKQVLQKLRALIALSSD